MADQRLVEIRLRAQRAMMPPDRLALLGRIERMTEQDGIRADKLRGSVPVATLPAIPASQIDSTEGAEFDSIEDEVAAISSTYAPKAAKYIVQESDGTLTNEQDLSLLATGLMKVTTGTGVVSTAVPGTDYPKLPLHASASLNFPSIGAANTADADEELTISVTGAVVGDGVVLGPPATLDAGLSATGYVSAADTVTIRLANHTNGAINPAAATWHVYVYQP